VSPVDISPGTPFLFSSDSSVEHARCYCETMMSRLRLGESSLVVELGSNDGYFLPSGVAVLGIEPVGNIAAVAIAKGVPTLTQFFGVEFARQLVAEGKQADLLITNNVLAQVPDLNDFVAGMRILLAPGGVATVEFPHLVRLFADNQFDTIYHEHFSCFSLLAAQQIFASHGLTVVAVEELAIHGGSLWVYLAHKTDTSKRVDASVARLFAAESAAGFGGLDRYLSFGPKVEKIKHELVKFLIQAKSAGKTTVGYGAPGKGNTLLNYCGIRANLLDYTVDRNPYKQGRFLPDTHIPIYPPSRIAETRPDYVLILAWNLRDEIIEQLDYVRSWAGRFVVAIPAVQVS